jgi:hypothetical protein
VTGISLSDTARDLVRSGLFGKDWETNRDEIISFIQLRFGPEIANNITASEQGIKEVEMFAFGLATANWFGDRQADDTNLMDARLRAAAVTIARQLGYKPSAAVPPAVRITMTLAAPAPSRFMIERGRKLQGPGGLFFEASDEVVFDTGESGPKTFVAIQGETKESIYTSDGQASQYFHVTSVPAGTSIAQDSPRLYVDGAEWNENRFLIYEQTNQFEFQYGFSPTRLVMGDGVAGNIPENGAELRLTFFVTAGANGTVAANTITAFAEPVVAGTSIISYALVHADPSTPGAPRESINSIKTNAPQVYQAAQRAVTQVDLDGWINSFTDATWGSVAIGRATTPRSVEQDAEALTIIQELTNAGVSQDTIDRLYNYWNTVLASNGQAQIILSQILAADSNGRYVPASQGLAEALENFLNLKAESTAKVHVTDGSVNLLSVDLSVAVTVDAEYSSQTARETIRQSVVTVLEDALLGRHYGESLRISDLYGLVENVVGVDWSNITIVGNAAALPRVNSHRDLVIESHEVITMGLLPAVTASTAS